MPVIKIHNNTFTYNVTYSKSRKTICLKLVNPTEIQVTAPATVSNSDIEKILYKKYNWIEKQAIFLKQLAETHINTQAVNQATILFLGQQYVLNITQANDKSGVMVVDDIIRLTIPPDLAPTNFNCSKILEEWYKKSAANILLDKTRYWSAQLSVSPTKITIKDQKTRWGSCSNNGSINYNWRIIMAPPEVINYLVIHELTHLIIPNHSQDFWKLVAKYCPEFKKSRCWLKANGQLLMRFLRKG